MFPARIRNTLSLSTKQDPAYSDWDMMMFAGLRQLEQAQSLRNRALAASSSDPPPRPAPIAPPQSYLLLHNLNTWKPTQVWKLSVRHKRFIFVLPLQESCLNFLFDFKASELQNNQKRSRDIQKYHYLMTHWHAYQVTQAFTDSDSTSRSATPRGLRLFEIGK